MTPRFILLTLLAGMAAVVSAQQTPDRTRPPQPGPPAPLNLPAIQRRQLSNGLSIRIVELQKAGGRPMRAEEFLRGTMMGKGTQLA